MRWRRMSLLGLQGRAPLGTIAAMLTLAACGGSPHHQRGSPGSATSPITAVVRAVVRHPAGGIAFIIGASTDPYGNSQPKGLGVVTGATAGRLRTVDQRIRRGPYGLAWLATGKLVVSENEGVQGPPAALYGFGDSRLVALGRPPLRPGDAIFAWSPNRRLIAIQPWMRVSCGPGAVPGCVGIAPGDTILVERADGSDRHRVARGQLRGWASDNRLVVFQGNNSQFSPGKFMTLDLRSDAQRRLLTSTEVAAYEHVQQAELGDLAYSADQRYVAALALLPGNHGVGIRAIVIARADGSIVRVITSTDIISMLAWSPRGDQLAYTTSGFPAPHELYLLRSPEGPRRRILSQGPHFDWVTWSPNDHWLLIDNEHLHAWDLLRVDTHIQASQLAGAAVPTRRLPRLGGEPIWCCPQDHYAGS